MSDPRVQLDDQNCVRGDAHTYTVTVTQVVDLGPLTTGLSSAAVVTALAVSALTTAVAANAWVTVSAGNVSQQFQVAAPGAAVGDTSVPVQPLNANYSYAAGSDVTGPPAPKDLTTYGTTWTAVLRIDPDSDLSFPWTIDASGASGGVLVLSLTGDQTDAMPLPTDDRLFGVYYYDVQVTGGAVSPQTPFKGLLNLFKDDTYG